MVEVEDMYLRALAGKERALGPEHTSTLDTVNNLGILYRYQGKLREAEDLHVRALVGYEKALVPEHKSILSAVLNLGTLYRDQDKLREAEDMYVRALVGHEKALGPEHRSTLDTVNNLGALFAFIGELSEGKDLLERAVAGYEKTKKTVGTRRYLVNLENTPISKMWRGISKLFKKNKSGSIVSCLQYIRKLCNKFSGRQASKKKLDYQIAKCLQVPKLHENSAKTI